MIPKIIHQTGPSDTAKWHPLWSKCQASWQSNFKDFEYKFWSDEDIDDLVKKEYPDYWEMYNSFPVHIMKIDFVRFCIMDKFGGIYADLDYFCYKNFESLLTKPAYVVENPFGNDPIENSLMCSIPNSIFFKKCLEKTKDRFNYVKETHIDKLNTIETVFKSKKYQDVVRPLLIFYISGTNCLSSVYRENKNLVDVLDGHVFNNLDYSYDESYITKHIHTGTWGKEDLEFRDLKTYFATLRNIPVEKYDFYTDYSEGSTKPKYNMNYDKNDLEPLLQLKTNYNYF